MAPEHVVNHRHSAGVGCNIVNRCCVVQTGGDVHSNGGHVGFESAKVQPSSRPFKPANECLGGLVGVKVHPREGFVVAEGLTSGKLQFKHQTLANNVGVGPVLCEGVCEFLGPAVNRCFVRRGAEGCYGFADLSRHRALGRARCLGDLHLRPSVCSEFFGKLLQQSIKPLAADVSEHGTGCSPFYSKLFNQYAL